MIVDANSNFLTRGHEAAVAAKKEREGKGKDAYGSKSNQATNIKEVCSLHVYCSIIFVTRSICLWNFKGAMSQLFLCLEVNILLKSKLRAFSYLQNGFSSEKSKKK